MRSPSRCAGDRPARRRRRAREPESAPSAAPVATCSETITGALAPQAVHVSAPAKSRAGSTMPASRSGADIARGRTVSTAVLAASRRFAAARCRGKIRGLRAAPRRAGGRSRLRRLLGQPACREQLAPDPSRLPRRTGPCGEWRVHGQRRLRLHEVAPTVDVRRRVHRAVVVELQQLVRMDLEMQVRRCRERVSAVTDEADDVALLHVLRLQRERRVPQEGARSRTGCGCGRTPERQPPRRCEPTRLTCASATATTGVPRAAKMSSPWCQFPGTSPRKPPYVSP